MQQFLRLNTLYFVVRGGSKFLVTSQPSMAETATRDSLHFCWEIWSGILFPSFPYTCHATKFWPRLGQMGRMLLTQKSPRPVLTLSFSIHWLNVKMPG